MNLRTAPDTKRLTLIADNEMPMQVTLGELREQLGAQGDQVLSTGDANRIWPAYSEASWRKWASEGLVPGAWQDAVGGPWRLPFASCKSFVLDLQRRALRRGKKGPRGPWATRQTPSGVSEGAVLRGGPETVERGSADDEGPEESRVA